MKKISPVSYLLFLIVILLILPEAGIAQNVADTSSAKEKAVEPIELVNINYEIGVAEKAFQKMESDLQPDKRYLQIKAQYPGYKQFLEKEAGDFKSFDPNNLSKFFLESSYRLWEGFNKNLLVWQTEINTRVKLSQDNISELDKIIERWTLTLNEKDGVEEPKDLRERIIGIVVKAKEIKGKQNNLINEYILLEDQVADLSTFCSEIIAEVLVLQQYKRDSLF